MQMMIVNTIRLSGSLIQKQLVQKKAANIENVRRAARY